MATAACDPKGACPRCGYANGPGATRCLRCHQILAVPRGCSGLCTRCLMGALTAPEPGDAPIDGPVRTKSAR